MTATERQARYDAAHTRRYGLKLNTTTDADVIAWLEAQTSMQGAVKALIRAALAEEMDTDTRLDTDLPTGTRG